MVLQTLTYNLFCCFFTDTPNLAEYGIGIQVSTCALDETSMDSKRVEEIGKLMNNVSN